VKALKRQGINAEGHVLATRKATKRIVSEAERLGCDVIVMGPIRPGTASSATSCGPRSLIGSSAAQAYRSTSSRRTFSCMVGG